MPAYAASWSSRPSLQKKEFQRFSYNHSTCRGSDGAYVNNIENRVLGAIMGFCVGDALGVPYEFHAASEIPRKVDIDYAPPSRFIRAHASVAPGTWSDDSAQALCLLTSALRRVVR